MVNGEEKGRRNPGQITLQNGKDVISSLFFCNAGDREQWQTLIADDSIKTPHCWDYGMR